MPCSWTADDVVGPSMPGQPQPMPSAAAAALGPPMLASGLPAPLQDIVTRYASGTGHHVTRRFGWDCHGLPVEYEIDKKLSECTGQPLSSWHAWTFVCVAGAASDRAMVASRGMAASSPPGDGILVSRHLMGQ